MKNFLSIMEKVLQDTCQVEYDDVDGFNYPIDLCSKSDKRFYAEEMLDIYLGVQDDLKQEFLKDWKEGYITDDDLPF